MFPARLLNASTIAVLSCMTSSGFAAVVAVSGDVSLITAPSSVLSKELVSNDVGFLFAEGARTLTSSVPVAEASPSLNPTPGAGLLVNTLTGTVPAGSLVESYFLHFDVPPTAPGERPSVADYAGSITFNAEVLGVVVFSNLSGTDEELGSLSTAYPTSIADGAAERDQEFVKFDSSDLAGCDSSISACEGVDVSADRRTVTFRTRASSAPRGFDQIRILVVPEPTTSVLGAPFLAFYLVHSRWTLRRRVVQPARTS